MGTGAQQVKNMNSVTLMEGLLPSIGPGLFGTAWCCPVNTVGKRISFPDILPFQGFILEMDC